MSNRTIRLISEIEIHERPDPKPYRQLHPSQFYIIANLKCFDRGTRTDIGFKSRTLFDPNNKSNIRQTQINLRGILGLDNDTIREVMRRLKAYIALNPRPTRLEVLVTVIILDRDCYTEQSDAVLWLMELASNSDPGIVKRVRVKDLDFEDGDECSCPICLEDIVERRDSLFSGFLKCFDLRKDDGMVTCLPCNHVFHDDCIGKWLSGSSRCPVCRLDLKTHKLFMPF